MKTMIDLFAGCGGLSLGMENAGFKPVFASELNHDAMASYLENRPALRERQDLYCHDIDWLVGEGGRELKALKSRLSKRGLVAVKGRKTSLDLICGGPPCQGFSGIGHRRSYGVDKQDLPSNQLFHKMLEVIKAFRPKVFLFENVKGLLSAKWTSMDEAPNIWKQIFETYRDELADYTVRWELVRAKDYGVPQNRPRVLMVGIRNDVRKRSALPAYSDLPSTFNNATGVAGGLLPIPTPKKYPHPSELLGDLVDTRIAEWLERVAEGSSKYPPLFETTEYPRKPKGKVQNYFRQVGPNREPVTLTQHAYSKHKMNVVLKFKHMIESGGQIPQQMKTKKFAQRVLKESWPEEGPNITATSLPDDYVHYSQPRILSVREWARLQMFPDWYQFCGKRTTGGLRRAGNPREGIFDREVPMYTQIGNAVPVRLAEAVGHHFQSILDLADA